RIQRDPEPSPRAPTAEPQPPLPTSAPALPPIQRAVTEADADAPTTPAPATATTAAPRTVQTEEEINQLFQRLYPRVRDELRWDLRIQRERAGLLADPM